MTLALNTLLDLLATKAPPLKHRVPTFTSTVEHVQPSWLASLGGLTFVKYPTRLLATFKKKLTPVKSEKYLDITYVMLSLGYSVNCSK
jgi:hypothetical protein